MPYCRMSIKEISNLLEQYVKTGPDGIRELRNAGEINTFDYLLMLPAYQATAFGCIFANEADICKYGCTGTFENRGLQFTVDLKPNGLPGFSITYGGIVGSNVSSNVTFCSWTTKDSAHHELNGRQLTNSELNLSIASVLALEA